MRRYYDLIPSQLNMYMLVKFSFHKEIVQIPASFSVDKDIDFDLLTKALNVEIKRNDSLRLRFRKRRTSIRRRRTSSSIFWAKTRCVSTAFPP